MRYPNVARAVFDTPWPITQSAFNAILEVIEHRLDGGRLGVDEIRDRLAQAEQAAGPRAGAGSIGQVAVIPIYGVLSHRINMLTEMSGGTSVQQLTGAFRQAMSDPSVSAIVFDVDSPGGSIAGIPELATEIRNARGTKPMVAVSDTLNASAAYWLASQADEVIVSPSSLTGSIGVLMAHDDISGLQEQMGVKTTLIYAGKYKVEGNEYEPLEDEAKAYFQGLVDDSYATFVGDVAKGRGAALTAVRDGYGQGRVLSPKDAVSAGLADRIGTLEDAIARVSNPRIRVGRQAYWTVPVTATAGFVGDAEGSVTLTSTSTNGPVILCPDCETELLGTGTLEHNSDGSHSFTPEAVIDVPEPDPTPDPEREDPASDDIEPPLAPVEDEPVALSDRSLIALAEAS